MTDLRGLARPFSSYGFRQAGIGDVDWPVGFVLHGTCCDPGWDMHLCVNAGPSDASTG